MHQDHSSDTATPTSSTSFVVRPRVIKNKAETGVAFSSGQEVANFMWGKNLDDYVLFINEREYSWPKHSSDTDIIEHIKACLEIELAFYAC